MKKIFFLTLLLLNISGCFKITSGVYSGTLFKREKDHIERYPVSINIQVDESRFAILEIKDMNGDFLDKINIKWNNLRTRLKVSIPSVKFDPFILNKISFDNLSENTEDWSCYSEKSLNYSFQVCLSDKKFLINISEDNNKNLIYSLFGDFSSNEQKINLEDPKIYSEKEIIHLTQTQNFDSKIGYEKFYQSQQAAKVAYYNLAPHFGYHSLLTIPSLNILGLLHFISDFLPFIIPNNWIKAKAANTIKEAEQLTYEIIKLELTKQSFCIAYVYEKEKSILEFYNKTLDQVEKIFDKINLISKDKKMNTSLDELLIRVEYFKNMLRQEILKSKGQLNHTLRSMAMSLGLSNPQGVSDLILEDQPKNEIVYAKKILLKDLYQIVIERSLQLKQINYLLKEAQFKKAEYYFNLIDPNAASNDSLSLSLIPHFSKSKSFIKEIIIKKEKLKSEILQRLDTSSDHYNYSLSLNTQLQYWEQQLSPRIQDIFYKILHSNSPEDITIDSNSFHFFMQSYIQNEVSYHENIARFRVAKAQINQLLLEDYYSRFQTSLNLNYPIMRTFWLENPEFDEDIDWDWEDQSDLYEGD